MSNLQLPLHQDHKAVLGSEYCSGYTDLLGRWTAGFYCPLSDGSADVFCCGSDSHKYCCTRKDQISQHELHAPLTLIVGILVGLLSAALLLLLFACMCCSFCPLYRKRGHNSAAVSAANALYRLQRNTAFNAQHLGPEHSASSGTQLYSLNNSSANSRVATPNMLEGAGISHSHTLPHNLGHAHGPTARVNGRQSRPVSVLEHRQQHRLSQDNLLNLRPATNVLEYFNPGVANANNNELFHSTKF